MNINFLAQLLGIIAIVFWIFSIQKKEQHDILFLQFLANCVYVIQYFLLGALAASSMNFISALRCYIFYSKRKNNKEISIKYLIFFIVLIVFFGIVTYKNYLSLIPILITIFYSISNWFKDAKWIRIVILITAFIWIYYNYVVGAYICIIGNIFEIISGTTALLRFGKKNNSEFF